MDNVEFDPACSPAIAWEAMEARRRERDLLETVRPFRFEDLNGRPEPASWGPKYSKPVKRKAFNDETNIPTNCASGQKHCFSAEKHRATLRAKFHAQAAADRLAWASGKLKDSQGRTIREAYALAMREKRSRARFLADVDAFNAAQPCEAA